eukprot:s2333_g12.t1
MPCLPVAPEQLPNDFRSLVYGETGVPAAPQLTESYLQVKRGQVPVRKTKTSVQAAQVPNTVAVLQALMGNQNTLVPAMLPPTLAMKDLPATPSSAVAVQMMLPESVASMSSPVGVMEDSKAAAKAAASTLKMLPASVGSIDTASLPQRQEASKAVSETVSAAHAWDSHHATPMEAAQPLLETMAPKAPTRLDAEAAMAQVEDALKKRDAHPKGSSGSTEPSKKTTASAKQEKNKKKKVKGRQTAAKAEKSGKNASSKTSKKSKASNKQAKKNSSSKNNGFTREQKRAREVPVQDLAIELGTCNLLHLQKVLTRYEGLTPKQAKVAVQRHFRKYEYCVYKTEVAGHDGTKNVSVWVCDVNAWLARLAVDCHQFTQAVLNKLPAHSRVVPVVLYHDACQGGNVLSPNPSFKVHAVYLGFNHLPQEFLRSPLYWLPIGLLDQNHASLISGGIATYMQLYLQQFHDGVQLGPTGPRLQLVAWVGDYEAQRATFSSRGSAGLLPCLFCGNVVSKSSNLAQLDQNAIVDISCGDPARFFIRSDADVFALCDSLLQQKPLLSAAAFETKCKAAGLTYDPHALLWNLTLRAMLPPSKCLNEPGHIFILKFSVVSYS